MQAHITQLAALAMDLQVFEAAALLDIADQQMGRFFATQAVVQQHGENRPIALIFQGARIRPSNSPLGRWSPRAGVLPSWLSIFGRLTPCTGLLSSM